MYVRLGKTENVLWKWVCCSFVGLSLLHQHVLVSVDVCVFIYVHTTRLVQFYCINTVDTFVVKRLVDQG